MAKRVQGETARAPLPLLGTAKRETDAPPLQVVIVDSGCFLRGLDVWRRCFLGLLASGEFLLDLKLSGDGVDIKLVQRA